MNLASCPQRKNVHRNFFLPCFSPFFCIFVAGPDAKLQLMSGPFGAAIEKREKDKEGKRERGSGREIE